MYLLPGDRARCRVSIARAAAAGGAVGPSAGCSAATRGGVARASASPPASAAASWCSSRSAEPAASSGARPETSVQQHFMFVFSALSTLFYRKL